jgi:hypothetical protein
MDGWMDEWMDGWMNGWMDGWMDAFHLNLSVGMMQFAVGGD